MEEEQRCAACGGAFRPCARVRDQQYCGKEECRRTRRRRWQRAKLRDDADYRDNQARAHRGWAQENSAYWRSYRLGHPDYAQADRERAKQQQRDRRRRRAAGASEFAKMDSIMVKITLLSKE